MDKKYQVFISSTYKDLREERQKVISVLLSADCIPAGMEAFIATDEEQFSVIKKVIDLCDYYILIVGNRYGSINEKTGISFTEMEYDYAIEKEVPVLVFVVESRIDTDSEDQNRRNKLEEFKKKVLSNRLASMCQDLNDLQVKVSLAIMKAKTEFARTGWRRYEPTMAKKEQEHEDLALEAKQLKKENERLASQLKILLNTDDKLAFEEETITVKFYYFSGFFSGFHSEERVVSWKELFKIVSLCMFHVQVKDSVIEQAIKEHFFTADINFYDKNLVKRIIHQFEALGLIEYKKTTDDQWYWTLTAAGSSMRKKLVLIKKGENI